MLQIPVQNVYLKIVLAFFWNSVAFHVHVIELSPCVSASVRVSDFVSKYRAKDIGLSISPFCTQFNRIAADLWRCYTCTFTQNSNFEFPTLWLNHRFILSLYFYIVTYLLMQISNDQQWTNDEPTMNKIGFIFVEVEIRKNRRSNSSSNNNSIKITT